MKLSPRLLSNLLLLSAVALAGQHPKRAPDLEGLKPGTKVDVIVQFASHPKESDFEEVVHDGAKLKRKLHAIKAGVFSFCYHWSLWCTSPTTNI